MVFPLCGFRCRPFRSLLSPLNRRCPPLFLPSAAGFRARLSVLSSAHVVACPFVSCAGPLPVLCRPPHFFGARAFAPFPAAKSPLPSISGFFVPLCGLRARFPLRPLLTPPPRHPPAGHCAISWLFRLHPAFAFYRIRFPLLLRARPFPLVRVLRSSSPSVARPVLSSLVWPGSGLLSLFSLSATFVFSSALGTCMASPVAGALAPPLLRSHSPVLPAPPAFCFLFPLLLVSPRFSRRAPCSRSFFAFVNLSLALCPLRQQLFVSPALLLTLPVTACPLWHGPPSSCVPCSADALPSHPASAFHGHPPPSTSNRCALLSAVLFAMSAWRAAFPLSPLPPFLLVLTLLSSYTPVPRRLLLLRTLALAFVACPRPPALPSRLVFAPTFHSCFLQRRPSLCARPLCFCRPMRLVSSYAAARSSSPRLLFYAAVLRAPFRCDCDLPPVLCSPSSSSRPLASLAFPLLAPSISASPAYPALTHLKRHALPRRLALISYSLTSPPGGGGPARASLTGCLGAPWFCRLPFARLLSRRSAWPP